MGAVMGSKNLKAIVATGGGGLPITDPEGFLKLSAELKDYLIDSSIVKVLGRVGTPLLYEVSNHLGAIRTRNSQDNRFWEVFVRLKESLRTIVFSKEELQWIGLWRI